MSNASATKSDQLPSTSTAKTIIENSEKVAADEPVIGIDLGTTFSCACVLKKGKTVVVPNDHGNRTTPSVVAFTEFERLIGDTAKNQQELNVENTIYNVKRLIGRNFNDAAVTKERQSLPYTVVNMNEKPLIQVQFFGKTELFTPVEISAMILKKLKSDAESFLNCSLKNAVITVPAHSTNAQREATKLAGKIAGLNVLAIMNEPTAAALAYGIDDGAMDYQNVIIFDLGGGTFGVTLLSLGYGVLQVEKTEGNTRLGGEDFVTRSVDHCLIDIKKSLKNETSLKEDKESMQRLRTACEIAKTALSDYKQYQINLKSLFEGKTFNKKISRFTFEQLNNDLFDETLKTVQNVLADANMSKEEIGAVVLVGGSSRIRKIQEQLKQFFGDAKLNQTIHPDEAVAIGAAIRAAHLVAPKSHFLPRLALIDVSPHSVGIMLKDSDMKVLIPRNKPLPFERAHIVRTSTDYQKKVQIEVYEGESAMVQDNNFLGAFMLTNITPALKVDQLIEVEFKINEEGNILRAKATDKSSGSSASSTLKITSLDSPTEIEIQQSILRLNQFDKIDEQKEEGIRNKNELGTFCNDIISNYAEIVQECQSIQDWLEEDTISPPIEYSNRLRELKRRLNDIKEREPAKKRNNG